jgi:hypothetical protein
MPSSQPQSAPHRTGLVIAIVAIAVVSVGLLTLLVQDRWHSPVVRSAGDVSRTITRQAAAGVTVLPTDPRLTVEPTPAGPKQAQPANPG